MTWRLERLAKIGGFVPYLGVGEVVSTLHASAVKMSGVPTHFVLECQCESVSGTKYVSRISEQDKCKVSEFEIRTVT